MGLIPSSWTVLKQHHWIMCNFKLTKHCNRKYILQWPRPFRGSRITLRIRWKLGDPFCRISHSIAYWNTAPQSEFCLCGWEMSYSVCVSSEVFSQHVTGRSLVTEKMGGGGRALREWGSGTLTAVLLTAVRSNGEEMQMVGECTGLMQVSQPYMEHA